MDVPTLLTHVEGPDDAAAARLLIDSLHPGSTDDVEVGEPLCAGLAVRIAAVL